MSSAVGATSFRSRSLRQPHGLRSNPRAGPLEMPALEPKQGRRASFLSALCASLVDRPNVLVPSEKQVSVAAVSGSGPRPPTLGWRVQAER